MYEERSKFEMLHRSCGSPLAPLQGMTLKAGRRESVVNDWVDTRISDWMVAMIDEALGKEGVMESHPQEHQVWKESVLFWV